jgi:pilus assembly protein Flp/PilA
MKNFLREFLAGTSGATAIEYALIAGLISIALISAMNILSPQLATAFQTASEALPVD